MSGFKTYLKVFFLLLPALVLTSYKAAPKPGGKTVVYIVRHGEKEAASPSNSDPELSAEGILRAEALLKKLRNEKVSAIFSTKYKRTIRTVAPLATRNGLSIENYNPTDYQGLAATVREKYAGKTVVIAGHSNTVLEIAEAFGAVRPVAALTEDDYDLLFKVVITKAGETIFTVQRFGASHHSTIIKAP